MEKLVVSASVGVMKPLLAKLTTLMGVGKKEVAFLVDELSAMDAFLEKMGDADELDPLAKNWRSDIREMAYDIEDCIDDFMYHHGGDFMHHHGGADDKLGFLQKSWSYIKTLNGRYKMANQIQEMKARVIQASDRRKRYKLDDCVSTSRSVPVDPRLPALYKESASLVGIDGPRDELIEWAADEERQLKVVSIVGFGGLGKTTLANEVYRKIEEQFNCKAFVSVSQRPDMKKLLIYLLSKIGSHPSSQHPEVQDLIDDLRKHLQHKRTITWVDWSRYGAANTNVEFIQAIRNNGTRCTCNSIQAHLRLLPLCYSKFAPSALEPLITSSSGDMCLLIDGPQMDFDASLADDSVCDICFPSNR